MQRTSGLALLTGAGLSILPACALSETGEERVSPTEWLDALVVTDGISEDEANTLAGIYFHDILRIGCGSVAPVTDEGGTWVASTAIGFAALPGSPIVIDKRIGRMTFEGASTIEDPKTMAAEIERLRRDPLGTEM